MTTVQRVAQILGGVFILIGLLGFFVDGGTSMVADPDPAPELLGLFPVNLLHNIAHLGLGIWGVVASRSWSAAKTFNQVAGIIYLLLTVLAFVSDSTFGLMPIGGHDIWLHALLAAVQLYFGFTARPADRTATV
ncbi:MAG TPA: DUF4383 domain-containing protein [Longimicrobiaceae bacterium]|nr:DUF4383 domain-containing protein [Longimicrobiaceae bacterium]